MCEGEAKAIHKINRHNKVLSVLGILPNQLRTLMKNAIGDSTEEALTDIRKTLFLGGYRVWKKRKLLVKEFWASRAPDEWKKQKVKTQDKKKKKRYNPTHCTNPFII